MKKSIMLILLACIAYTASSQTQSYYIDLSGDTIYADIKKMQVEDQTTKFIIKKPQKKVIKASNAIAVFFDGKHYVAKQMPKSKNKCFMKVEAANGEQLLVKHKQYIYVPSEAGGFPIASSTYYLYDGENLIRKVKSKELKQGYDKLFAKN